jgi:hypothetical protein
MLILLTTAPISGAEVVVGEVVGEVVIFVRFATVCTKLAEDEGQRLIWQTV